ncbi:Leucine-rich repeat, cysteine-containing subtype [Artemisia annua]|uniref:Leucine-rich repeat, cysteine-containing subtype n=1 Tax=Artemisia annua TaxID=35608 RepID=A0A2U1P6R2_ARTAN|nr:Leucine-rich repeat, cysteine-containing subtype [Artemisia annua]
MEPLGDDELISIFENIDNTNDRKSFYRVSNSQAILEGCMHSLKEVRAPLCDMEPLGDDELISIFENIDNTNDRKSFYRVSNSQAILEGCMHSLKEVSLALESAQDIDPQKAAYEKVYEFDFDNNSLCKVANACIRLYGVNLSRRLHVGDVVVYSLLRSCKNLEKLYLERCVGVTDESLKAIGESNSLKHVSLKGCLITDLGLQYLQYLAIGNLKNSLTALDLCQCDRISDAGIFYLKELRCLIYLNLSKCGVNVTDTGHRGCGPNQNSKH